MTYSDQYLEQCCACADVRPCVMAIDLEGRQHHLCIPCGKAEEARGRAIEVRFAVSAVDLAPGNFGERFLRGHDCD